MTEIVHRLCVCRNTSHTSTESSFLTFRFCLLAAVQREAAADGGRAARLPEQQQQRPQVSAPPVRVFAERAGQPDARRQAQQGGAHPEENGRGDGAAHRDAETDAGRARREHQEAPRDAAEQRCATPLRRGLLLQTALRKKEMFLKNNTGPKPHPFLPRLSSLTSETKGRNLFTLSHILLRMWCLFISKLERGLVTVPQVWL